MSACDPAIDWTSAESHLLLNPRLPDGERVRLSRFVVPLEGHVWLSTSGSTGALKLVALSKAALLASAAAVNRRLAATTEDVWGCVLPSFHVGGLSIFARAHLSGSRVVTAVWDPARIDALGEVTLLSLVPAQVSDLVERRAAPPPRLRAVVVGGGRLRDDLYERGLALGWPLLPSYGMTECGSQVATAVPGSPELLLLDHLEARCEPGGRLAFRGASLLTGYGSESGLISPLAAGWFVSEDRGSVEGRVLRVEGRGGSFVKIGGEAVDLVRLERIVEELAGMRAAVVAVADARLGYVIHLVVEEGVDAGGVSRAYDGRVLPFERARAVHVVRQLPRSELGKLRRTDLLRQIGLPE